MQNADASADKDDADKVLESRFVIAQMFASAGHHDEALTGPKAVCLLLADNLGVDSTQVRNLNKQIDRLGSAKHHGSSSRQR